MSLCQHRGAGHEAQDHGTARARRRFALEHEEGRTLAEIQAISRSIEGPARLGIGRSERVETA